MNASSAMVLSSSVEGACARVGEGAATSAAANSALLRIRRSDLGVVCFKELEMWFALIGVRSSRFLLADLLRLVDERGLPCAVDDGVFRAIATEIERESSL